MANDFEYDLHQISVINHALHLCVRCIGTTAVMKYRTRFALLFAA